MNTTGISRRGFLTAAAGVGGAGLLAGCVGSGGSTPAAATSAAASAAGPSTSAVAGASTSAAAGGSSSAAIVFQNSIQDTPSKSALTTLVKDYKGGQVTMNSVATEQFRAQLSTYLTSSNPPDVMSWYAGSVANTYAEQGLLLDVSDLWKPGGACADYSASLKTLSTDAAGKQIFVPVDYYWWSIFYLKSAFQAWDVAVPTTWDEFMTLCATLKKKGIYPLTNGIGPTPWMASGWFDYLDLRINGAAYHRELLAGKHSFSDKPVKTVMEHYTQLLPYFDPSQSSWDDQQAATPLFQKKAGMYLVGAFVTGFAPKSLLDDIDFFSVPTIDPSVRSAEEAPTDGFFASAKGAHPDATKAFLSYMASPTTEQQYIKLAGSSNLPTSPKVDTGSFSPLVKKGIKLLTDTKDITQFFNRDSSDALQTTADNALTKFIAEPASVNSILDQWQTAAVAARTA